jgi:nucleoid-associated protein YgaU
MEHYSTCAFCDQSDVAICRRCGRHYCHEHGTEMCDACLDPESGVPSGSLFRIAAAGMLVAAICGIWFLVRAPRLPGESAAAQTVARASGRALLSTPSTPFAAPSTRVSPIPSNTPDLGPHDYTIKPGDTLDAIGAYYGVTTQTILQLNPQINPTNLHVGQVIHIPAR